MRKYILLKIVENCWKYFLLIFAKIYFVESYWNYFLLIVAKLYFMKTGEDIFCWKLLKIFFCKIIFIESCWRYFFVNCCKIIFDWILFCFVVRPAFGGITLFHSQIQQLIFVKRGRSTNGERPQVAKQPHANPLYIIEKILVGND